MIAWDPSLATGDAMIDSQHQELYRIVNDLHEACSEGVEQSRVDQVLDELLNYTVMHFGSEEDLMRRYAYPAAEVGPHVQQHNDLRRRVGELLEQKERGELQTAMPVVELVHAWLGGHINITDRKLARFVSEARAAAG
jgi:hemerythrin-like metal-binding protein